jgi:hypothetical protein
MSCSANQSRQAAIIQELPGIGTWAGRQRLFELPRSNAPPPPSAFEALVDACVDNTKLAQNHSPNDSVDSLKEGGLSSNQKDFTSGGSGAGSGAGSGRPNGYANGHVSGNADGENVGNGVITNGYAETVLANGINLDRGGLRNFGTRSCDSGGSQKSNDSEEQMNLAWRWRFTRKWEAEQRRALNGGDPLEEGADDDLDALRYVQACGVGLDLQVTKPRRPSQSRNICVGGHGRQHRMANGSHAGLVVAPLHSSASMSTMQFEVDASYIGSDLLGHEDSGILHSTPTPIAETPDAESTSAPATRDILSVAFRGKELMEAQKEIEKAAMARWEQIERACSGSVWAGANLTAVEIDMYGRFIYVLLRVYEPTSGSNTGRQRFLVRGHQGSTPKELMEIVVRQIAGVCASQGLPIPMVDMVGLGVLEWRQDTDRHVVLSSADALTINQYKGLNGNDYTVDVSGLAASLVRQSLPCHFLVRQEKTGSSSFPGTLAIWTRLIDDVFLGIFHCIVPPILYIVLCTSRLSISKHSNESCFDCISAQGYSIYKDI